MKLTELSKVISHALRHEPWLYELELDENGWVFVDELIDALKSESSKWDQVNINAIENMINLSEKKRFEISNGKIRALYGHSTPVQIIYKPCTPPPILYHGTTKDIAEIIKKDGLKPMNRQYVHLSNDILIAKEVAKRKGKDMQILKIDALNAVKDGIEFYASNGKVWLCNELSSKYINHE